MSEHSGHKEHEHHEHADHHEQHEHEAHHEQHTHHEVMHHAEHKKPGINKVDIWKGATAVLVILLLVSLFTGGFGLKGSSTTAPAGNKDEVGTKAVKYINDNLLDGGGVKATLTNVEEKSGLFVVKIDVAGKPYDSYVSKDGTLLFPSGLDITKELPKPTQADPQAAAAQQQPADVVKSDKPKVELFVMSHCPYGTQAEKGLLPVSKLLGDKIDFNIRYVYYAMHGKTELDEQLRQYCIQEEQKSKFYDYLLCFLEAGKSEDCITKANIDKTKLSACVETSDKKFKVTELFNDQSTWLSGRFPLVNMHKELNDKYGVRGSPTFVLNGKESSAGRDSASFLSTICNSFNKAPEECKTQLSSKSPGPGFGFTETDSQNIAQCGSA